MRNFKPTQFNYNRALNKAIHKMLMESCYNYRFSVRIAQKVNKHVVKLTNEELSFFTEMTSDLLKAAFRLPTYLGDEQ